MKLYKDDRYFALGGKRSFVFDNLEDALAAEFDIRKALFSGEPTPQYTVEEAPPTEGRVRIYDDSVQPERVLKDTITMLKSTITDDTLKDSRDVFDNAIKNSATEFLTVWGKLPSGATNTEFLVDGENSLFALDKMLNAEEPSPGITALIDAYLYNIPVPSDILCEKMYILKNSAYISTDFAGAYCELLRRATANVFSHTKFWNDWGMQQSVEFEYIIDRYIEALELAYDKGYKASNDVRGKLKFDCCCDEDNTAKRLLKYIDALKKMKSAFLHGCNACDAKELYDMGYEWPDIETFLYDKKICYTR